MLRKGGILLKVSRRLTFLMLEGRIEMYSGAYCHFSIQRGTDGGAYQITGSMNVSRDIATTASAIPSPVNRRKHEVVKRTVVG